MTLTLLEKSAPVEPAFDGEVARVRVATSSVLILFATLGILWIGAASLVASGGFTKALEGGWAELAAPVVLALVFVLLLCERWWPAERHDASSRGLLHDACFLIFHLAMVIPLMTLLAVAFAHLLNRFAGGSWHSWSTAVPLWVLALLTLVLMDGCNWLAHWCEHRFNALWRMHALHHSQEELNVLTSFRAHPLSHFMGFFFATIPVVVVMGGRPLAPVLISLYVCLGTFPHANVTWTFGPLGKFVVSPAYHRLHHSRVGALGVNLGIVLTWWDVLSRRAMFPQPGDAPCPTGVSGRSLVTEQTDRSTSHVALLLQQLAEPFAVREVSPAQSLETT